MNSLLGGRYLLGQMIGTGGMADVYIAQDQRLSREVAIKILRSDLARDPSFIARFKKEALACETIIKLLVTNTVNSIIVDIVFFILISLCFI